MLVDNDDDGLPDLEDTMPLRNTFVASWIKTSIQTENENKVIYVGTEKIRRRQ